MMIKMRRSKGFTLVELLLVVAILAVLAFLAVPAIASTIRNARVRTCGANERMIEQGVWRWYADQIAAGRVVIQMGTVESVADVSDETEWDAAIADYGTLDPIGSYFTPSGIPSCPFDEANVYGCELVWGVDGGLDDLRVTCDGAQSTPDAEDGHPRAQDRWTAEELAG